jgi:hypothetical protein
LRHLASWTMLAIAPAAAVLDFASGLCRSFSTGRILLSRSFASSGSDGGFTGFAMGLVRFPRTLFRRDLPITILRRSMPSSDMNGFTVEPHPGSMPLKTENFWMGRKKLHPAVCTVCVPVFGLAKNGIPDRPFSKPLTKDPRQVHFRRGICNYRMYALDEVETCRVIHSLPT